MHTRAASVVAVLTASLACAAPAGAAQVEGSLQVTEVTPTTVTFTVTAKRICAPDEQCDYFSEVDQIDGDGPCPAEYPADPWIAWTGQVLNTGPSAETGTITPRGWLSKAPVGPSRLCVYTYADRVYYLTGGATIVRPSPPGGGDPSSPGAPKPKAPGAPGSPSPTKPGASTTLTCARYIYQQQAQKALDADPSLAARLDRNDNGVACEGVPKRKTYVRTVRMAAAATATRAALRRAYGTAFTRGSGYRSRCDRRSRTRVRCAVAWKYKGAWQGSVDVVGAIRKNEPAIITHVNVRRP